MAVPAAFANQPDFQLDSVCDIHQACATAMHCLICYGTQINRNRELFVGLELFQIHVLVFFFHKETVDLAPNVLAVNAIVVQHVGRAVNHNVGFYQESLAPAPWYTAP